jgi:hypothetical protein
MTCYFRHLQAVFQKAGIVVAEEISVKSTKLSTQSLALSTGTVQLFGEKSRSE